MGLNRCFTVGVPWIVAVPVLMYDSDFSGCCCTDCITMVVAGMCFSEGCFTALCDGWAVMAGRGWLGWARGAVGMYSTADSLWLRLWASWSGTCNGHSLLLQSAP